MIFTFALDNFVKVQLRFNRTFMKHIHITRGQKTCLEIENRKSLRAGERYFCGWARVVKASDPKDQRRKNDFIERLTIVSDDRKSGGKSDDKTGQRINGVMVDEMETKSSSHRASHGSSRIRGAAGSQWLVIGAELALLAAVTAGWSTGRPADAVAGVVSLALVASPSLFLLLWACCSH